MDRKGTTKKRSANRRGGTRHLKQGGRGLLSQFGFRRNSNVWCYYAYAHGKTNKMTFHEALSYYISFLLTKNKGFNEAVRAFLEEKSDAHMRNLFQQLTILKATVTNATKFRSSFRSCNGYDKATDEETLNISDKLDDIIVIEYNKQNPSNKLVLPTTVDHARET